MVRTTGRCRKTHCSQRRLCRGLILLGAVGNCQLARGAAQQQRSADTIQFPESFAFGTSTSAYQVEGSWLEGGRGLSIWDAFSHTPGKIKGGDSGDTAADHFRRFRSDVRLMAQMSLKYYRFSISWSRIIPTGNGPVNEEGVRFYSALIDELLKHNINPVVTLYHWDLPISLQLERDGWLSHHTANAFVHYASVCFARFGDRVKYWITLNEPMVQGIYGYARGTHAPGRSSAPTKEPYIAVHYMLLAHAYAAAKYRKDFKPKQKGIISIALNSDWREPLTASAADVAAAQRSMEFNLGWLADPIYFGDYPASMRSRLGARLPTFTPEQQRLLMNSTDFFALQHYSTLMVAERPADQELPPNNFYSDEAVAFHNVPGAKRNMLGWDIAPFGIYKLLKWVHHRYTPSGGVVITENGLPLPDETAEAARRDTPRVCFLKQYLAQLHRAMREGVDCRGYFVWSLFDNFEWAEGHSPRFGLLWVDYSTMKRTAKASAAFYAKLSQSNSFTITAAECNATLPVLHRFKAEAAELQRLVGAGTDAKAEPKFSQQVAIRSLSLAGLAEQQARYDAEQGSFDSMRHWLEKARKFRAGAQRQRQQLLSWIQARRVSERQKKEMEELSRQTPATAVLGQGDGSDDLEEMMELPEESFGGQAETPLPFDGSAEGETAGVAEEEAGAAALAAAADLELKMEGAEEEPIDSANARGGGDVPGSGGPTVLHAAVGVGGMGGIDPDDP